MSVQLLNSTYSVFSHEMLSDADLYRLAADHYANRRWNEALAQLAPLLARSPADAGVMNLAAVCAYALDRPQEAQAFWERAINEHPEDAGMHNNLANLFMDQGRLEDAASAYRHALVLRPDFAQAHYNLGNVLLRLGRTDEAERRLRHAIETDPGLAQAHFVLAGLLARAGRTAEAETAYRRAIAEKEDYAEACNNLGNLLNQLQRFDEAVAQLSTAVRIRPDWTDARLNLAIALRDADRLTEAEAALRSVLERQPGHLNAMTDLADVLVRMGCDTQAETLYRELIALFPTDAAAFHNLGNLLFRRTIFGLADHFDEAERVFREALRLEPDRAGTRDYLGLVMAERGRIAEAELVFRDSLKRDPRSIAASLNLAVLLSKAGRLPEAWPLFEGRHGASPHEIALRTHEWPYPRWRGEPLTGKHLVVLTEQGFGDDLQFCRYLPMLRRRGVSKVTLVCTPALHSLLSDLDGVDVCVTAAMLDRPPNADYWCLTFSLPHLFGTTLSTIPASVPYLRADTANIERWRARLPARAPKVGIVWCGEARPWAIESVTHLSRRWLEARLLAPLLELPDISFVSLQKGAAARSQLADVPEPLRPLDLMDDVTDFADTAALIESLDLVISIDTSVAHLAGALGKPVWILLCANACWRWLDARDDSPWYPSARLFRQEKRGAWEPVIARVIEALRDQRGGYSGELRDERAGP
jgi:tetratricopeptide (TPR) repeat protein